MTAVKQLTQANIVYVNEGYTQEYDQLTEDGLKALEKEAFLTIITGEKPLEYFDTFVETWYNSGGRELTEEANRIATEG